MAHRLAGWRKIMKRTGIVIAALALLCLCPPAHAQAQPKPEIEIVDPYRARSHLREPWPEFMIFYGTIVTGAGWIVPRKYVGQVGDDGFKNKPIGLGPYKFVSHTPGVELVMEAFEGYWRKVP